MPAGLATHVWNNNLKSVLLLLCFPLLLALMIGMFSTAVTLVMDQRQVPMCWQSRPHATFGLTATGQPVNGPTEDRGYYIMGPSDACPAKSYDWTGAVEAGAQSVLRYLPCVLLIALGWFTIACFTHGRLMQIASGSQPVTRQQMPRIYNLLENLCISRGLAMPQFEVIDSPALNAFASGINDKTYRIVLTRGLIERLDDDELESVIGHELTHIINRDARLLIIAVVFSGMIGFLLQVLARALMHGRRPNLYMPSGGGRRGGGVAILALVGLVLLVLGYILSIALRFAISRKREYLADAGSVELTKNPEAMMRALQRIAGAEAIAGMPGEIQQMCIENSHNFLGIFATHPPIADRIAVLSRLTGTPVPVPRVSLRRGPRKPWAGAPPPVLPKNEFAFTGTAESIAALHYFLDSVEFTGAAPGWKDANGNPGITLVDKKGLRKGSVVCADDDARAAAAELIKQHLYIMGVD